MHDLKFIREHPDLIKKDLEKRQDKGKSKLVDQVLDLDQEWRKLQKSEEELRHSRNEVSKNINEAKKKGGDAEKFLKEAKEIPKKIQEIEEKTTELKEKIHSLQLRIPNILHDSVPVGKDDSENKIEKTHGKTTKPDENLIPHGEWIQNHGLGDFDKAAKVAGHGFNYLIGDLALLDQALQQYAISLLVKKGYKLVEPPFMLRKKPYEGVTDLADFETMMYKIEGEDLYLIATSEHPICAYLMNETLDEKQLPIKYIGISSCFRKEIGSHGIDERGLFRVHQFNKIEQFIFCKPEDSWKFHEKLIKNAEEIFKNLKLPYRIVNVCTGDIGIVAAKKYDLEVWMPREQAYKEVVSCSNCTSYQATRLNIKYKSPTKKDHVHTLNSTAIATGRAIRAIIENFQEKNGEIKIPEVLLPFMHGIKKIGKAK
ncbi:MAG: serine--tRNA ligase [Nanoarchaeota archaeon]